jgi:hypothetical protein
MGSIEGWEAVLRREKVRQVSLTRVTEFEMATFGYAIGKPHLIPADFEQRVADAYARQGVPRPAGRENPA